MLHTPTADPDHDHEWVTFQRTAGPADPKWHLLLGMEYDKPQVACGKDGQMDLSMLQSDMDASTALNGIVYRKCHNCAGVLARVKRAKREKEARDA